MSADAELQACAALMNVARYADAARRAELAVAQYGTSGGLWHLLGAARLACGASESACAALERAVALVPRNAAALDLLGVARQRCGDYAAAADAFSRSLGYRPGAAGTWANAAANACARRRFEEALEYAQRALEIDPALGPAMMACGTALSELGRHDEASSMLERACARMAGSPDAEAACGMALRRAGRRLAGIERLEACVRAHPGHVESLSLLAAACQSDGDVARAIPHYQALLELTPDDLLVWNAYLFTLLYADWSPQAVAAAHRAFGEHIERPWRPRWIGWSCEPDPERRLRVGMVSGDLREHAAAYYLELLWAAFDRKAFELLVYRTSHHDDACSRRLRGLVDAWADVDELSDDAFEARIRADRIDILIDLSGHTDFNRLGVFARKPAPLQVSCVGYPNTTGLSAIDYRPVPWMASGVPVDAAAFSETLIRLSGGEQRFTPPRELPPVVPPPVLSQGRISFGSFNRPDKLYPRSVALWSAVLRKVPDARMVIGGVREDEVRDRIVGMFADGGIEASRLVFMPRMSLAEYFSAHAEVDILLDAQPYSGGATTDHALWMGVPTVTLTGAHFQQRSTEFRLRAIDLDAWVADSEAAFVDKAVAFAQDRTALAELRAGLRERLQARHDRLASSRDLGDALRIAWRRWCAGLPAAEIVMETLG